MILQFVPLVDFLLKQAVIMSRKQIIDPSTIYFCYVILFDIHLNWHSKGIAGLEYYRFRSLVIFFIFYKRPFAFTCSNTILFINAFANAFKTKNN
jgi:hypothetical protein